MEFWEKMRHSLDKGVESSREMFGKARDRAKELGEKGVIKYEIMQLENQAEKLVAKLGTRTYEVLVTEQQATVSKGTAGIKEILQQIDEAKGKIQEKEKELAQHA